MKYESASNIIENKDPVKEQEFLEKYDSEDKENTLPLWMLDKSVLVPRLKELLIRLKERQERQNYNNNNDNTESNMASFSNKNATPLDTK